MTKKKFSLFKIAIALMLISILSMASLLIFVKPHQPKPVKRINYENDTLGSEPKPVFRKDGELTFRTRKGQEITKIEVEVADDEVERMRGLMYRDSMAEKQGMLFLFEREEPMSFWMKNTHIPLDIIYVDAEKRIVHIATHTKPYSEEQIPSPAPAQFVVEVNAGFTQSHSIQVGDLIQF